MTNDLSNLTLNPSEYFGDEHVRVGDGTSLPIQHTGGSTLSTSHGTLLLNNLLHVPHLTKNHLSVHQFCADNQVFCEFHSSFFCVKDVRTGRVLLSGPTSNGLYKLPTSVSTSSYTSAQAFIGERASLSSWHQRLGHPILKVVRQILQQFQLTSTKLSTGFQLCPTCCKVKSHVLPFPRSFSVGTTSSSATFYGRQDRHLNSLAKAIGFTFPL